MVYIWTRKMRPRAIFSISYSSYINDLAMTCRDYVNARKLYVLHVENTLFLELTMAIPKKW